MKKNRNAFFQESTYQSFNPSPNNMAPYETSSNYYYQGPMPYNYNTGMANNDIENRFAKIERQLNRLDYRISKLENKNISSINDDFDNNNSNMYMI